MRNWALMIHSVRSKSVLDINVIDQIVNDERIKDLFLILLILDV
ncbi:hypothetical protein BH23BAC2_BH23BAC2_20650 [soil metagenome]